MDTAKRKLDNSDSLANHEKKAEKEKEHIFGTVEFTDADIPDTEELEPGDNYENSEDDEDVLEIC